LQSSIAASLKGNSRPLTVKGLAEKLGVSGRHIYRLVEGERIPHYRIKTSNQFDPVVIAKWLEDRTVA
jgi:excisionase family DNA binding protein